MDDANEWVKEAMLLSRLNHKNIVRYEDHLLLISKETYSHPCILTEYCRVSNFSISFISIQIESNNYYFLNFIYRMVIWHH